MVVEGTCQVEDDGDMIEHFYCDIYHFSPDDKVVKMSSYFVFTDPDDEEFEFE